MRYDQPIVIAGWVRRRSGSDEHNYDSNNNVKVKDQCHILGQPVIALLLCKYQYPERFIVKQCLCKSKAYCDVGLLGEHKVEEKQC